MTPEQTGRAYDKIASWWTSEESSTGLAYLRRAIDLCAKRETALDVGCGAGRFFGVLAEAGFRITGVDVSEAMLSRARKRHPSAQVLFADICQWQLPGLYDMVVAWDSTFHVPHHMQHEVHKKLCGALADGGVILMTAGGVDGEITGMMHGEPFYYSSLDQTEHMMILRNAGCQCVQFERDQFPENHCVIIGIKGANHTPDGIRRPADGSPKPSV
jgi:SAM-dependent methyltransferase